MLVIRPTLLAAALVMAAVPASADWLVLRDGSRLETEGTWKVEAKRITFTLKRGGLSSLRSADVDLEASALATRAERDGPPVSPQLRPGKRPPVLVLTDADVGHSGDVVGAAPPPTAGQPTSAAEAKAKAVEVSSWDRALSQNGQASEVTGTVRNNGKDLAVGIRINVRVFDETGALAGSSQATVSTSTLPPGGRTDFRAEFPGVHTVVGVKFDIDYQPVLIADDKTAPEPK